jgi:hypothetical protein
MSIMNINNLFLLFPTYILYPCYVQSQNLYILAILCYTFFFQWIRSWAKINLQCFLPWDERKQLNKLWEKTRQCFWSNKSPFLFLGPIFNGPFSWPFWFFLPTLNICKNQEQICYILLIRFCKHVCNGGQVGLNFSLSMQLLIHA